MLPNITVKRAPTKPMASPFMGFAGALNLLRSFRRRLPQTLELAMLKKILTNNLLLTLVSTALFAIGVWLSIESRNFQWLSCCVPRDHIPLRSYALFEARSILRAVFDA